MRVAIMRTVLVACLVLGGLSAAACSSLVDPAKVEGALPGEANQLRIIQAALVVKAANTTISQQLQLNVITVPEAVRLRALTKQAEAAVVAARDALPLANGTTTERIAALNALLLQLLREQVIKAGVS